MFRMVYLDKNVKNLNWANEVKIENRKFNLKYTYK